MSRTYEEWRVTGEPGGGFPRYEYVWSPDRDPSLGVPAECARQFVASIQAHGGWPDGPHLSRRTVTVTDWEPQDVAPPARSDDRAGVS